MRPVRMIVCGILCVVGSCGLAYIFSPSDGQKLFEDSPLIVFLVMGFGFLLIFGGILQAISSHVNLLRSHGLNDVAGNVEAYGTIALVVILFSAFFLISWLVKD